MVTTQVVPANPARLVVAVTRALAEHMSSSRAGVAVGARTAR